MEKWSLSAEMISIIAVIMMIWFSYNKEHIKTVRRTLFIAGLYVTLGSSLLNVLCTWTIENYSKVPRWVNIALNSLYFLLSITMATLVAAYLFELFLEHVYEKYCRTRAMIGTSILVGTYLVIFISNFWNGCLFWFDNHGGYHRGVLNKSGYFIMLGELILTIICYFHNRSSVEKRVIHVMRGLPALVVLMSVFQIIYPEVLMNGMIGAFVYLIIFANFQNIHVEHDSLTGIRNRKSFYSELSLRQKGGQEFQVVLVSLNNFAVVNQKFGYHKGDEFLYVIARWLDECVPNGRAFRFGNVTFAVLCPYISDEKSSDLVNKIVERFEEPWKLGEIQYTISACYGAMSCRKDKWDSTQIIEILAFMMEIAKTKEGGRVEFDAQIEHMFLQKKNLLILLRDSIEKKRFEVWYQPVIDCKTHEFVSAEALLRLRDYKGNMVSPAEFIPVAEENGMIEEIGWIVWDEVCQFLAKYRDLSLKYISLNMSVQQFMNPELFKMISDRLEKNNLDASKIKLEITERVVLADEVRMQRLMNEFSSKGLKFAMDDFGTGYSNFASVMHLPFEMIKLDRSLLREMHNNIKDMHVVKSMIELFHSMGFQVVSEGVETEEQQRLLMEMGTNYIQGFYYARPMPKEKLVEFLKEG